MLAHKNDPVKPTFISLFQRSKEKFSKELFLNFILFSYFGFKQALFINVSS